jgi:thioredoxin 2
VASTRLDPRGVVVSCPACSRANRLTYAALRRRTRCAHCKGALPPPAAPAEAPDTLSFDAAYQTSELPLVVDFWAPWCGPCRMVAPELERVAHDMSGEALVVKVNTDALTDVAGRFRIRSIPTLAVLHRGREVWRTAGARSAAEIASLVRQALADDARRAS